VRVLGLTFMEKFLAVVGGPWLVCGDECFPQVHVPLLAVDYRYSTIRLV
jgi:hypothetical protein